MLVRWIVIVSCIAGCDRVWGLDEVKAFDARVDTPGVPMVHGKYVQHFTINDPTGAPILVEEPYPVDRIRALVSFGDSAAAQVAIASDGSFSFLTATSGQPYSLQFQTPLLNLQVELSATQIDLADVLYGRPDRRAVPAGTELRYNVGGRPGGLIHEEVVSTGIWTRTTVPSSAIDFGWETAGFLGTSPGCSKRVTTTRSTISATRGSARRHTDS